MIPDFPHNIKIGPNEIFLLHPDVALCLPCLVFLNKDSQQSRDLATSGCKEKQYYEESLVSSNLNSKQLRFHGAHPK